MALRKSTEDNEILGQIRESLAHPMDDIEEIKISSEAEAETETTEILNILDHKSDWDRKCKVIQRTIGLIKGGALSFEEFQLPLIIGSVSRLLGDVRSTLIKYGTLLIAASVQQLQNDFVNSVDLVIPSLFKQTNCGKIFITGSCKYTIFTIVEHCQRARTLRTIIAAATEKSPAKKLIVGESIVQAMESWPSNVLQGIMSEILKVAKDFESDASADVREVGRTISELYAGMPPSSSLDWLAKRTPKTPETARKPIVGRKKTTKTASRSLMSLRLPSETMKLNRTCVLPNIDLTNVMPPATRVQADQFCRQLTNIVKNESFSCLEGLEFALPNSIIDASTLSNQFSMVLPFLPKLFDLYESEFSERIAEVLLATGCDVHVVKRAVDIFGVDEIIENFRETSNAQPAAVITFFVVLLQQRIVDEFDAVTTAYLKRLIPRAGKGENVQFLKDFLRMNDDFDSLPSPRRFSSRKSSSGDSTKEKETKSVDDQVESITRMLVDDSTVDEGLCIIIQLRQKAESLDLHELIPHLLLLTKSDNLGRAAKSHKCLFLCTRNVRDIYPFVLAPKYEETAICFLAAWIAANRAEMARESMLQITEPILKNMQSLNLTLRRCATEVMAQMMCIHELTMKQKTRNLPSLQQRMLEETRAALLV